MSRRNEVLRFVNAKRSYMEDRIKDGIETNRKGVAHVTLTDAEGKALSGTKVKLVQKNHAFRYGANLFMLDEFDSAEKNQLYRKYFAEGCNIATLPFYWSDLEPEQGKPRFAADSPKVYRRPAPDLCLDFCEANGIEPKAHCLNYAVFTPEWAPKDITGIKLALEKRFAELAERYKHRINLWEVTNETFWGGTGFRCPFYHQPDFVEWSFKTAEKYFPANRLAINEAHSRIWQEEYFFYDRSPYYMQIERAMLKGARIDSIGMQYHMFYRAEQEAELAAPFYDPERVYDVMDTYEKLGKPLHITELTIPAYSNGTEDEELQAEIIRTIYSMWFSHAAMEGILYWNLIDGYAYNAEPGDMTAGENYYHGGLLRFDFTPKPAYHMIRDLFTKEWHTELDAESDAEGQVVFKGFYGDYDVIAEDGRKGSFSFRRNPGRFYINTNLK